MITSCSKANSAQYWEKTHPQGEWNWGPETGWKYPFLAKCETQLDMILYLTLKLALM